MLFPGEETGFLLIKHSYKGPRSAVTIKDWEAINRKDSSVADASTYKKTEIKVFFTS